MLEVYQSTCPLADHLVVQSPDALGSSSYPETGSPKHALLRLVTFVRFVRAIGVADIRFAIDSATDSAVDTSRIGMAGSYPIERLLKNSGGSIQLR